MAKRIFVPELFAEEVEPILIKALYKLPRNVVKPVRRWHLGKYYGYGSKDLWIPLNDCGGISTHAFDEHTVKFPAKIDAKLRELLRIKKGGKR